MIAVTADCDVYIIVNSDFVQDCATSESNVTEDVRDEIRRGQVRREVERSLALYVSLDDARLGCIGESKYSDLNLALWKATIGAKLARIARACGMCRPAGSVKCAHVSAVLRVAVLRNSIEQARISADFCGRELGSATRRKHLGKQRLKDFEIRAATARRFIESHLPERQRLARTNLYSDGIELVYLACSDTEETRRYCFVAPFSDRWS